MIDFADVADDREAPTCVVVRRRPTRGEIVTAVAVWLSQLNGPGVGCGCGCLAVVLSAVILYFVASLL